MAKDMSSSTLVKRAFPEGSVKLVLQEFDLHRGDELITSLMQTILLPRCMYDIYKSATIRAHIQHRKFVNADDLTYADSVSVFKSQPLPGKHKDGILIEHRHFAAYADSVRDVLHKYMNKWTTIEHIPKMSENTSHFYQQLVEDCIRRFVSFLKSRSRSSQVTFQHFNSCMSLIMGDWSMLNSDETFGVM